MQQWIDLNAKIANDSIATLKQLGEINAKASMALFEQQKEMVSGYTTTAKSNVEKLSSAKDQKSFLTAQNEIFKSVASSALGNWNKTVATANESQEAYRELAEKTMQAAKSNMEETVTSVKESTEAVKKAVKRKTKK